MTDLFAFVKDESGQRRCAITDEVMQKLLGTSHISLLALVTSLQEPRVRRPQVNECDAGILQDARNQVQRLLSAEVMSVAQKVDLRRWHEFHDDKAMQDLLSHITAYAQGLPAYVLLGHNGSLSSSPANGTWHESHHHIIRTGEGGIQFDFTLSGHGFTKRSVKTIAWKDLPSIQNFEFLHTNPREGFPPEWLTSSKTRRKFQNQEAMATFMRENDDVNVGQNYDVIEGTVKTWLRQIKYDTPHWITVRSFETLEREFARLTPDDCGAKLKIMTNQVKVGEYPNLNRKIRHVMEFARGKHGDFEKTF